MMAVNVKRLNSADNIDLTRAEAKSDRQQGISRRQRAMLEAAAEDGLGRRWAIIKVEHRRENDVDKLLCRAMIEHWLPLRRADDGRRRSKPGAPVWLLAWPGFMFVKIPDTAEAWHGIASVKHVTKVLGVGERPFFFDDNKLLRFKAELATLRTCDGPETLYVEGEAVLVTDGPFATFPGKVIDIDQDAEKPRARVEVMIFGRATPVELDLAQLAKR